MEVCARDLQAALVVQYPQRGDGREGKRQGRRERLKGVSFSLACLVTARFTSGENDSESNLGIIGF